MNGINDALFDPGNLIVNMIGGMLIQAVYLALLTWIVPPRSKRVFWFVELVCTAFFMFLKPVMPALPRLAASVTVGVFLPIPLLRGSLFTRVFVCTLAGVAQTVAELVCMVGWVSITGLGVVDNKVLVSYFPVYLVTLLVGHGGTMFLLAAGIRWLVHRFLPTETSRATGSRGIPSAWVLKYLWFPVLQFTLFFVVVEIGFDVLHWKEGSVGIVSLLGILCLAVDVLLFVQIGRSVAQAQEEVRAAVLEERVGDYLGRSERVQALLGETAHLRHDLRNHRMVVEALCERGEYERAEAYLDEFAARLAEGHAR